jgi:transposase
MSDKARIQELEAANARHLATNAELQETIVKQQALLESLQREIALLKRSAYGHRRERFDDSNQGLLFESETVEDKKPDDQPEDPGEENSKKRTSRGRVRRVIPETLPRVRRERPLSEDEIPEHLRGKAARRFFKKAGEWVEYQPPRLVVIEEFVETLAVDNQDATETELVSAKQAPRILRSFAGPSLLAGIAVNRFADHQPYYRLEEILQRSGLVIDRATQCRWMDRLADNLDPLVSLMQVRVLQSSLVQADETSVKLLQPGTGQTKTAYIWALLGDSRHPYTTFRFTEDRSRAGPDQFFANYRGRLLTDAYICYELLAAESLGRIQLAGCHVHARRKFEELHKLGPTEATATALGYFQRLFEIEDRLVDLTDDERHAQRQVHCLPLMQEFKQWLDAQLQGLRPKHELRGAIQYMTKRWECFTRFLESGDVPAHNNASEQAVKVAVIGKKNWLFFGSADGGETAAKLFTLTATCRRLKIDPHKYMTDVCQRWPECDPEDPQSLEPLLPDRWLAEHPDARLEMRVTEAEQKLARKRAR